MTDLVRVTQSDAAVKFGALYMAKALGYFAAEGIDIVWDVDAGPGGSWLVDNLVADKAEIALGGIWLPLTYRQLGLCDALPFAALCHRNPGVVLGRTPIADRFDWTMLYGKRVLLSLAATSQWMYLEGVLKEAGIDMTRIKFVRDLHVRTMRSLWAAGYGDFFFTEPLAGEGLAESGETIAFTLAEAAGPVPWSVLYAKAALFRRGDRLGQRFFAAIERAAAWLVQTDPDAVGAALSEFFPKASPPQIARAVKRFRQTGVWSGSMAIDRAASDRYQAMMVAYGLLDRPEPYPATADLLRADAG